ncbi:MAG: hypothetical protein ACLR8Y_08030 [Alistipes indistinctus]
MGEIVAIEEWTSDVKLTVDFGAAGRKVLQRSSPNCKSSDPPANRNTPAETALPAPCGSRKHVHPASPLPAFGPAR